jgi:CBS domain-containing protein/ubiquinone/menaquinone biosynthesis C-methylase UbiE
MKVSDVMQKSIFSVSENTPVKEAGRMIFSLGIAGIPVLKGKKLVGIVTEVDILSRMYPTMRDLVEDYAHAKDFEQMEKNILSVLDAPVKEIMNKKMTTISPDTPLMSAESLMMINKFGRLPIVDKNNNLLGIISQGDIFRQIIKDQIPKMEKDKYADFIANHYDLMVDWNKRFNHEFPELLKLFKREKVNSVIDLGVWTGEHTVGLAKKSNLKILGLDHNPIMIKISNKKKEKLIESVKKRVEFKLTDFNDFTSIINNKFDAAISMGGALPYIPGDAELLFKNVASVLRENGIIVLQILNFDKIIKEKGRLLSFRIQKDSEDSKKEHLFLEFFERSLNSCIFHNIIIFESDGKNWTFKGTTSVEVCHNSQKKIEIALKKAGFSKISFSGNIGEYQGEYGKLSFTGKFDSAKSDWLNVVAKR